jgi:hypothetical protein
MTNTNLPEKLEVTIKVGRPSRDWKVELQKIGEKVRKEMKYVTYSGNISKQDVIRAAEVLKQQYWNWNIFINASERTIVFRKQI